MAPLDFHAQLASISLRVPDVPASARFYEDIIGLVSDPDASPDRAALGWGLGSSVLELTTGSPGLASFALEIPDPAELEGLLARLDGQGIPVTDAGEDRHVVLDPDGRELRLLGRRNRAGERTADSARRPIRLQHITLATDALSEVLDFYEGILGMRLSDRMGDRFVWLRCGCEHHTIAVIATPSATLIDHFSFDVASWQDFREWGDRLAVAGVDVTWGPGRHGPGNNVFLMFDDPDAFHIELSAEMELFYDDRVEYVPRVWEPATRTVNLWGQAPSWRAPAPTA